MRRFKARLLGTAPGKPVIDKHHSSLWGGINEDNFLIDCGEGVSQQLMRYELDKDVLDFIIISHFHPDHTTGIYMALQMIYLQGRTKPLTVYLPERVDFFKETMDMMYLFPERFKYKLILKNIDSVTDDYPAITIIRNSHLVGYEKVIRENNLDNEMKSWSIVINFEDHSLLYSSDFHTGLAQQIQKVDFSIVDALHPPITEIMALADKTTKKIYLTHGLSNELTQKLPELPNERFVVAEDGLLIDVINS